jgi:hypothetical protein
MAIKITVSKQTVACDKQKTALVLFLAGKGTQPAVSCLSRPRKSVSDQL